MNYRVLPLTKLTEHFARLPGIGKKSAQRLAFHILRMPEEEAKAFADTVVTVTKNGTTVKAGQLMKLMSLGVKQGDVVTVAAEGANEDAAIAALTAFFNSNL